MPDQTRIERERIAFYRKHLVVILPHIEAMAQAPSPLAGAHYVERALGALQGNAMSIEHWLARGDETLDERERDG